MRLQLIAGLALALAVVGAAGTARAQSTFATKVQLYADDDHTQVVSPAVDAHAEIDDHNSITAGYVADAVTSASIDIVSQASPITIHDVRHQLSLSGAHVFDTLTATLGYTFSRENDYLSHSINAGLQEELFDKNTTLAFNYGLELDTVGRADDPNYAKPLDEHHISFTWTQVVNKRLATQVGYELGLADGFQSSPYRFVPLRMSEGATPEMWVPETDPSSRVRHAVVVGANWFIPKDASLQADYRIYRDTWGITSHTVGTRLFVNLGEKLELRLRNRFYTQDGASFYQPFYATLQRYMTVDRELSSLWSETLGAKLMYKLTDRLEAELKLDGFYYSYAEFPALHSRLGTNAGVGLTLTY